MYGFSTVDGFMNVKEGVDDMIKYLANEPSVGLYFVQQHAQASMPYLIGIKDKVVEKVHETTLHTEDTEDSIFVLKSMTECGLPIVDEMIKDINRSLFVMSTSHPKKGLIHSPGWGFLPGSSTSSSLAASNESAGVTQPQNLRSNSGYFSTVLSSAKQKAAAGLRWPQPYLVPRVPQGDPSLPSRTQPPLLGFESGAISTVVDAEAEELHLSSQLAHVESSGGHDDTPSLLESFDRFRSDRESKLEVWLQEL